MKSCFRTLVLSYAVLAVWALPRSVKADNFLFGDSQGNSATLIITTNSGSAALSTGTSEFTAFSNNSGWWSATEINIDSNDNYFVGTESGKILNNFFTFDASALNGATITGATLEVYSASGSGALSAGPVTDVTYTLYDVSTPASVLNDNNGVSASIFNDLGSGVSYGQFTVSTGAANTVFDFNLNAAGIAAVQAAADSSTFFSVGGTLTPSSVPEPSSLALLGLGGVGLAFGAYRRRRTVAI